MAEPEETQTPGHAELERVLKSVAGQNDNALSMRAALALAVLDQGKKYPGEPLPEGVISEIRRIINGDGCPQ